LDSADSKHAGLDRTALLAAMDETSFDAIITINAKGIVQSFNPAAERLFGYTPSEARVSTASGKWQGRVIDYMSQTYFLRYWNTNVTPLLIDAAPLAGKTLVITGTIGDPRSGEKVARPAFQRLCERAGASTASSVSANTDMLICGAGVGASKTAKAEKLGVEIVDQDEIWRVLIAAGVA